LFVFDPYGIQENKLGKHAALFVCSNVIMKYKPILDIARIYDISASTTTVKHKFGIHIPREIKNAMSLDKKNKNRIWQPAIEAEHKQITEYETFIVLDSGNNVPKGYQKISYHVVFDVKFY